MVDNIASSTDKYFHYEKQKVSLLDDDDEGGLCS
jgi:hypothetical protein